MCNRAIQETFPEEPDLSIRAFKEEIQNKRLRFQNMLVNRKSRKTKMSHHQKHPKAVSPAIERDRYSKEDTAKAAELLINLRKSIKRK